MNQLYLIFYISSVVISSIITALFINRKALMAKWVAFRSKRRIEREERFKAMVKSIVLDYLKELTNEQVND